MLEASPAEVFGENVWLVPPSRWHQWPPLRRFPVHERIVVPATGVGDECVMLCEAEVKSIALPWPAFHLHRRRGLAY